MDFKSRQELEKEIAAILAAHGGLESNIPVSKTEQYWILKRQLSAITASK